MFTQLVKYVSSFFYSKQTTAVMEEFTDLKVTSSQINDPKVTQFTYHLDVRLPIGSEGTIVLPGTFLEDKEIYIVGALAEFQVPKLDDLQDLLIEKYELDILGENKGYIQFANGDQHVIQ